MAWKSATIARASFKAGRPFSIAAIVTVSAFVKLS